MGGPPVKKAREMSNLSLEIENLQSRSASDHAVTSNMSEPLLQSSPCRLEELRSPARRFHRRHIKLWSPIARMGATRVVEVATFPGPRLGPPGPGPSKPISHGFPRATIFSGASIPITDGNPCGDAPPISKLQLKRRGGFFYEPGKSVALGFGFAWRLPLGPACPIGNRARAGWSAICLGP